MVFTFNSKKKKKKKNWDQVSLDCYSPLYLKSYYMLYEQAVM